MSARWTPQEITDAQIRNARHAYYGAISYVDDNLGRLMEALRATGLADDTIVVFLSDHGEMLGERGLWFKMNFFEGGARVPLVISAPQRFAARRVAASVSLVDVLPTLVDLAGGDSAALGGSIDGRSLIGHLAGEGGHDEVIGEYLAEGRDRADGDDPPRRHGSSSIRRPIPISSTIFPPTPASATISPRRARRRSASPRSGRKIAQRWDLAALDARVRESQRRRRIVDAALTKGEAHSWDFQPYRDASRSYMRNTIPLDDLEAMARFPPVAAPECAGD